MHPYIEETAPAVKHLLDLAANEDKRLSELSRLQAMANSKFELFAQEFRFQEFGEDSSDMQLNAAHGRMAEAFKEKELLKTEIASLQMKIEIHEQSFQAIAGAILQIAKQGISIIFGDERSNAPTGRAIGTTCLRDIVWQGRNQAMHFESTLNKYVTGLFKVLKDEQGAEFDLETYASKSRAIQVLNLLGWNQYSRFAEDLDQILSGT